MRIAFSKKLVSHFFDRTISSSKTTLSLLSAARYVLGAWRNCLGSKCCSKRVLLDTAVIHHQLGFKDYMEGPLVGATLVYLPVYSPYFSAIELAFAQVKKYLKWHSNECCTNPESTFYSALRSVSCANARSYCRHCGYPVVGDMVAMVAEEEDVAPVVAAMGSAVVALVAAGDSALFG